MYLNKLTLKKWSMDPKLADSLVENVRLLVLTDPLSVLALVLGVVSLLGVLCTRLRRSLHGNERRFALDPLLGNRIIQRQLLRRLQPHSISDVLCTNHLVLGR